MPKAIIIGASSGIGRELAKQLSHQGYTVAAVARRLDLLTTLQQESPGIVFVQQADLKDIPQMMQAVQHLIQEMGGVDLAILNAGTGFINPALEWEKEMETISVNVTGCCALAGYFYRYFSNQKHGHLVGVSSIAAERGNDAAPAYNASKAFFSSYLQGLRKKAFKEGQKIVVTDIRPGFVDTDMAKGDGLFWVASPQKAAVQILRTIAQKRKQAYVTKRWRLIAWILRLLPERLYVRI